MEGRHFLVDGQPCSASLFDFAVYFFHNAATSVAAGQGPYFYLPKMESHLEARCAAPADLPRWLVQCACVVRW